MVLLQLDSEAEWEPEVEDGEDLGSDLDGEEKDDDDAMSEDEQVDASWRRAFTYRNICVDSGDVQCSC